MPINQKSLVSVLLVILFYDGHKMGPRFSLPLALDRPKVHYYVKEREKHACQSHCLAQKMKWEKEREKVCFILSNFSQS